MDTGRLTNIAEVSIRLLDLLPLHSHFGALPGDEKVRAAQTRVDSSCRFGLSLPCKVEPPRMSIKRRLRRLNAEEEKVPEANPKAAAKGKAEPKAAAAATEEKPPSGLPERKWIGLPKYELRALLCGGGWPADPVLMEEETIDEQKVQELTEPMSSFRSFLACTESFLDSTNRNSPTVLSPRPVHRSIVDGHNLTSW